MKVRIEMGYDKIMADLSGVELEQFTKIMAKMQRVDREYLNGRHMMVLRDEPKVEWQIEVGSDDAPVISKTVAKALKEGDQAKDRATYVAKVQEAPDFDNVEKLRKQLYYDNVLTKAELEEAVYEVGSQEHGVVDFMLEGTCVRVHADGKVERIALK